MGFINSIDPRNIPDVPTMACALRCVITDTSDPACMVVMPRPRSSKYPRIEFRQDDPDLTSATRTGRTITSTSASTTKNLLFHTRVPKIAILF